MQNAPCNEYEPFTELCPIPFNSLSLSVFISELQQSKTMISTQIANILGCLALIAYVLTLAPGIFRVVVPSLMRQKRFKQFFKPDLRRYLGILAFVLALGHAIPIAMHRRFVLLDSETYIFYFHGILSLGILAALAVTSNRWSQRKLKKHWKELHALTYFAMFFLTWHVISAMWGKWTSLTLMMIAIMFSTVGLFLTRRIIEHRHKPGNPVSQTPILIETTTERTTLSSSSNLQ